MLSRPRLPQEHLEKRLEKRLVVLTKSGARELPSLSRKVGRVASVVAVLVALALFPGTSEGTVGRTPAGADAGTAPWPQTRSDGGADVDEASQPRARAVDGDAVGASDSGAGGATHGDADVDDRSSYRRPDAGSPDGLASTPSPLPPTDQPSSQSLAGASLLAIEGVVLSKGTREPLVGATLLLDGHDAGETKAGGRFRLMIKPGGQKLLIQHPGFAQLTTPVKAPSEMGPLIFRLMPILSGQRYITEVRTRPAAPSVRIEGEEAREVPGSSGDPFRVLGTLPGVSQVAWPAAVYVVRGANPGNTGFFVDGIRVPALFHLGLGPSVIHPYLIEGLDFYPGAYPAAYGRYVSGIVAARTGVPPADRVHASVDVTVFDAGGVVTAPIDQGRGTISVAGRYSYTGAVFSLVQSDTTLGYADYQLRLDDRVAGGALTLFALGSWDRIGWAASMEQEGALQFHRIDLRYSHTVAGGRALVGVTVGHDRATSTLFYSPINVKSYEVAPRFSFERALGSIAELKLGGDAEAQTFRTTKPDFQGMQSDLTRPRTALQLGGYASLGVKLGALRVVPGVHVDNFLEENTRRRVVQPRLSAFLTLHEGLVLEGAVGRFAQMPSLPVSVPGFESFGLKSLGLQTSDAASLGIQATGLGLQTSMTGFFQRMRLSDITNIEIEGMNPTRENYLEMRDGTSYGVETLIRKRNEGRAYGWLAYTLSWSRHAVMGVVGPSDFDQRHVLNLVGGYRLDRGFTVGGRLHLHTGRYAPIFGKATPENPDTYRRLPTYTQLDLRVARHFVFDKLLMDLFLDLGNVAFQREVIEWARDPMTGQIEPKSLHIILPTLGVHIVY